MSDSVQIQYMKKEDLGQIQHLYQQLLPEGISMEVLERQYKATAERPGYYLLVAKREEKVVGTSIGILCQALDAPFLVIENVVVDEACHRRGVGREIFAALDVIAEENNCQYAMLVSSSFRKSAHRFYEEMGYTEDVRGFRKYY